MNNVKAYTDKQLIDRMKSLSEFTHVPKGYHIITVRSTEDAPDGYDDKLYLFKGEVFIMVMSCTTNSGLYGLKNFKKWNRLGAAVIKSNQICYNAFMKSDGKKVRHHNGKMKCLRLMKYILYYRDGNGNDKIDEVGTLYKGNYATNIHGNSYNFFTGIRSWLIGKWGTGCIVVNNLTKYYIMLKTIPYNTPVTVTILKEF
jgi:hypothetical protein